MITSGAVSAPHLPHHRRVTLQTRRTARLCRSPVRRTTEGGFRALDETGSARRARVRAMNCGIPQQLMGR
jgi:hypothetical protein